MTRSCCHLVGADVNRHCLQSVAFDITHKVTEFTFKADRRVESAVAAPATKLHNSLVDCHSDVWTRFPVIPAIQRHTVKSADRTPSSVLFVSKLEPGLFRQYFSQMIVTFENASRKPIAGTLDVLEITGSTYRTFLKRREQLLSTFKFGEWLVNMLCLIPIHLAVARDNRFIPLKDGVWSTDQEKALLGATVDQVIDNLSFGWYESIFQSYMASKVWGTTLSLFCL